MRILLNTLSSDDRPGGPNLVLAGTIRALAGREAPVTLAIPRGSPSPTELPAMRSWASARSLTLRQVWEQYWLPYRCMQERIDLIHSYGVLPAWQTVPGVLSIVDTLPLDPDLRRERRDGPYRHQMIARSIRAARRVIVPTQAHRDAILTAIPDMPAEKFTVVPFGVDEAFFRPDTSAQTRQAVALRYGLPDRFILHVGALTVRNNPAHIIQAYFAATVSGELPHRLVLIGRGHDNRGTLRFIREHALEDQVRLLPAVDRADLPTIMAMASCLVKPALAAGTGMALLEALAAGTPVIATDIPVYRELCAEAARYVPPRDLPALRQALENVLTDETRAATLRTAGQERAAGFSWKTHAETLCRIYEEALA